MEVSAIKHHSVLHGPTPFLRLQSDDRLVAVTRRGNQAAFEALVGRYQARLLAFCRHMLGSREDAEDVLQEVFAAAFNALLADDRPINVRPWLYRIARNRCLNHLRRAQPIGMDSMDVHLADHGTTTADRVHRREEFRELLSDVRDLAETQRTALLLREIDALSYEQIAEAMETTIPSVKSLLVRARVSLAEAAEARRMSCIEVREELGEVAEGLKRKSQPVRRHVKQCERCDAFETQLKATNRALAAVFPVGPLLVLKKLALTHLSGGAGAAAGGAAAGVGAAGTGSAVTTGIGALATKTVAGLAAAAIVTAGAVEVDHSHLGAAHRPRVAHAKAPATVAALPAPRVIASTPQIGSARDSGGALAPLGRTIRHKLDGHALDRATGRTAQKTPVVNGKRVVANTTTAHPATATPAPAPTSVQTGSDTSSLGSVTPPTALPQPTQAASTVSGTPDGAPGAAVASPPPTISTVPPSGSDASGQPSSPPPSDPAPATSSPQPTSSTTSGDQTTAPASTAMSGPPASDPSGGSQASGGDSQASGGSTASADPSPQPTTP